MVLTLERMGTSLYALGDNAHANIGVLIWSDTT